MGNKIAPVSYGYIARVFLKIGAQAFGGWPTSILLVEKELVDTGRLTKRQFQGAVTCAYLIPGALQVSFISHIGYRLKGFGGATLATVCYLFPALGLMVLFAALYFRYLQDAHFASHTAGLSAALGGVILASAYRIGKGHVSHPLVWLLAIAAFVLRLWVGVNIAVIILGFGLGGVIVSFIRAGRKAP